MMGRGSGSISYSRFSKRDGKPIHVTKTAWCAAAACCAWFTCYDPSVDRPPPPARVFRANWSAMAT